MSRLVKTSARLDGLDVSHEQSPPPTLLPANVHLRLHNCLADAPEDLVGVYDVIHIQNFNSIVRDNNPVSVIENMLKMMSK